ncbi:MAG: GGDEF domain-containing protein [Patescibacteria group bacterium]
MRRLKDFFRALFYVFRYGSKVMFKDNLTGLYNRQFFDRVADIEISRALRYDHPLSLVLIDLDDFKKYNDQFGHLQGDQILQRVGKALWENSRESDIPARWGGDEFVVLLPDTDSDSANVFCTRVEENIPVIDITYGFSSLADGCETLSCLISIADKRMYQHK